MTHPLAGFDPLPGEIRKDVTGRDVIADPFAKKDRHEQFIDDMASGRLTPTILADRDGVRLAKVVTQINVFGIKQSPELQEAMRVYGQVMNLSHTRQVPNVGTLPADQVEAAIAAAVEHEAKAVATTVVREAMIGPAVNRLGSAVHGMMPAALAKVAPAYASAAKRFTAVYPVIAGVDSVTSAAKADKTGEAVKAWWEAIAAVAEMTRIIDFLVSVDVDPWGNRVSSLEHPERYYALHADVGDAEDLAAFLGAIRTNNETFKTDDRINPPVFPLGIYPVLAAAGATLSLPSDRADWEDRTENYLSEKDYINARAFRSDEFIAEYLDSADRPDADHFVLRAG